MAEWTYEEAVERYRDLEALEKLGHWGGNGEIPDWVTDSEAVREGTLPVLYATMVGSGFILKAFAERLAELDPESWKS